MRSTLIETPDKRIRVACAAHNYQEALDALVRAFQHEIVGYCVNMLGDAQRGADVAQNVFLAAHTALARFRGEASYRTWLFAIARKQCLKEMKRASRHQMPSRQATETQASTECVMLELEEETLWEQRQAQLSRLLQRLKKRERDLVMMYYYMGWTYAEIAGKLWISETTARRRIQQALRRLEEMMRRECF